MTGPNLYHYIKALTGEDGQCWGQEGPSPGPVSPPWSLSSSGRSRGSSSSSCGAGARPASGSTCCPQPEQEGWYCSGSLVIWIPTKRIPKYGIISVTGIPTLSGKSEVWTLTSLFLMFLTDSGVRTSSSNSLRELSDSSGAWTVAWFEIGLKCRLHQLDPFTSISSYLWGTNSRLLRSMFVFLWALWLPYFFIHMAYLSTASWNITKLAILRL